MGGIHFAGDGVPKSVEKAYVWYRLAENNDCQNCAESVELIRHALSKSELSNAENLLNHWKPGQCEIELSKARED